MNANINIVESITRIDNLPSLPAVVAEILRLSRSDDVSMEQLADVIQTDPALAAKLLRLVNSSLFGLSHEITSIRQAITLLGLRTVEMVAVGFALADAIGTRIDGGFDYEAFWRRSLATAVVARMLARKAGLGLAEEAFVAGLVTDLGMVAIWQGAPEIHKAIEELRTQTGRDTTEIETDLLGLTHARIGGDLLRRWELPDAICAAVSAHHGEELALLEGDSLALANVVHCAACVADVFCQEPDADALDRASAKCIERTAVDPDQLHELLRLVETHVRETAAMLSVPIGQMPDYTAMLDAAAEA